MIKIEKEKLSIPALKLEKQETLIELHAEYYGVGMLAIIRAGSDKTIYQITATEPPKYATRIVLNDELLKYKSELKFSILIMCNNECISTNEIPVILDTQKIKLDMRQTRNNDIVQLHSKISTLEQRLNNFMAGLSTPNLPQFNLKAVKAGMVLTAFDDNGNIGFAYPFNDVITKINGKKSVSREVNLTGKDINLSDKDNVTLEEAVKNLHASQQAQATALIQISNVLNEINEKLTQLRIEFEEYKNSSLL